MIREYARAYHTSTKDLRDLPLLEFLRDYAEAVEESKEERKEAERQQKKAKAKAGSIHVRKPKRPRRRR